jgi:hypothetical protein
LKPFEVLASVEVGGLVGLYLHSDVAIEKRVADALVRLSSCPSSDWEKAMKLTDDKAVYIDVSFEQMAWLMELLDFSSGRALSEASDKVRYRQLLFIGRYAPVRSAQAEKVNISLR